MISKFGVFTCIWEAIHWYDIFNRPFQDGKPSINIFYYENEEEGEPVYEVFADFVR